MQRATLITRILFGLMFTLFGLNGVMMSVLGKGFMPMPEEMPEAAAAFFQAMAGTKYMLPLISAVQLVSGVMILTGLMVPLGLTLLAPLVVNIVLYHAFVDPNGMAIALVVLAMEIFLAWAYGPAFRGVLDPRAKPRWSG